jgi:hypothetical protein
MPFSKNGGQSLVEVLAMSDDLSMSAYNKFHDGFLRGLSVAAGPLGEKHASDKLEPLRMENRVALEISPSYGCKCFLIAQAVTGLPRSELNALNLW